MAAWSFPACCARAVLFPIPGSPKKARTGQLGQGVEGNVPAHSQERPRIRQKPMIGECGNGPTRDPEPGALLQIPVAQRIPGVPAHARENDVIGEVSAAKQRWSGSAHRVTRTGRLRSCLQHIPFANGGGNPFRPVALGRLQEYAVWTQDVCSSQRAGHS
jgi:hypothetical protein